MSDRAMNLKEKKLPAFQMFSAYDLEAQRVVQKSSDTSEAIVFEEGTFAEGDWQYRTMSANEGAHEGESCAAIVGYTGTDPELVVPSCVGGLEVRRIHDQVFERNAQIVSVELPDTVDALGRKVFFQCVNLVKVVMSSGIEEFDAQTFAGCRSLAEIVLPHSLKRLAKRSLFDAPLRTLELPVCLEVLEDQAINPATLKSLSVAAGNAFFSTDGQALFDASGSELKALVCQVSEYTVPDGCLTIGNAAFKGQTGLSSVTLNSQLERIGDFAFFRTGITQLECPDSLKEIGESAFSLCSGLERVSLNEGLELIGAQAFSKTSIAEIHLPASLKSLGNGAFEKSKIDFEGGCGFAIDESNQTLFTDGKALYRREDAGASLMFPLYELAEYDVCEGTVKIGEDAFSHQRKLERVTLPEGMRVIGDRAFKACKALTRIVWPDTIESIGDEAFWQTSLEEACIGPHVEHIGAYAFEVAGASRKHADRTLRRMDVSPHNKRYYFEENILIERNADGDRALMFIEPKDHVVIPKAVTEISETAFYHAHVREMSFHDRIAKVGSHALLGIDNLERIHIAFPRAVDGFTKVTVEFPYQARDMEDFTRPLCIDSDGLFFDFSTYDSMVVHEMDPTAVARMVFARFDQPVKLSEASRAHFDAAIKGYLNAILRRYAQENDFEGYEQLAKHGYLEGENKELALAIAKAEHATEAEKYVSGMGPTEGQ